MKCKEVLEHVSFLLAAQDEHLGGGERWTCMSLSCGCLVFDNTVSQFS